MPEIDLNKLQQNIQKSVIRVLEAQNEAALLGMNEIRADLIDRVFLRGEDVDGNKIGSYSTKPFYASLIQSSQIRGSSLKPRGKKKGSRDAARGSKTIKTKKKVMGDMEEFTAEFERNRKSMYLPGGYFEFRKVVGRQNSFVDLNLTGSLKGDIRVGQNSGSYELAFTTDKQLEIAEGNQDRFGKTIFAVNETDVKKLEDIHFELVEKAFFDSFT